MIDNGANLTLTIPQVAKLLGLGRNSAYAAAKRGEIPTIVIGRRILVPVAALKRLLEETGGQQLNHEVNLLR